MHKQTMNKSRKTASKSELEDGRLKAPCTRTAAAEREGGRNKCRIMT